MGEDRASGPAQRPPADRPHPRPLDGREYKVLIDPQSVGDTDDTAAAWLDGTLHPLVDAVLGAGPFERRTPRRRAVHFLDTADRALDEAGLSLRFRSEEDKPDQYTLKLRGGDRFVVAAADIRSSRPGDDKLEEDIGPLKALSHGALTVADPPDMRSRFALSVDEIAPGPLPTLGAALELFPHLDEVLRHAGVGHEPGRPLREGPAITERVFRTDARDFGRGVEGEFTLTLWTLARTAPVERVAEISWRCRLTGDHMPGPQARAALALFGLVQRRLPVDLAHPSKTKLALPPQGGPDADPD